MTEKYEIVFEKDYDKIDFVEFVQKKYINSINKNELSLHVKYDMPKIDSNIFTSSEETIVNILLAVSNFSLLLVPLITHYIEENGKKRIKIINLEDGEIIDIDNIDSEEVVLVLKDYYKRKDKI